MAEFTVRSVLPAPAREVLAWHGRPGAFDRLAPPWERIRLIASEGIQPGARAEIALRRGPVRLRWHALHHALEGGSGFADELVKGPFRSWHHEHRFVDAGDGTCILEDAVRFELTGLRALDALAARVLEDDFRRQFVFRHRTTRADLDAHGASGAAGRLRIGVTGASGTIGSALASFLSTGGHDVVRFVRRPARTPDERSWNPYGIPDPSLFADLDAVVHLSGARIPPRRWTARDLARLRDSRVQTSRHLAEALASLRDGPRCLIQAGGTAAYGADRPDPVDENSGLRPKDGALAAIAEAWESAVRPAAASGIRTVLLRIGPVLTPSAGMLPPLRAAARLPVVPVPGSGDQMVSWVAMDDVLGAILHVLRNPGIEGPVNLTAPDAAPLGRLLRELAGPRRLLAPVAPSVVRAALGQAADETVLGHLTVRPRRLEASGYRFRHPALRGALDHVLGRVEASGHPDVAWTFRP